MTDKDTQVIQRGKTAITKNNGVTVIETKGKPKLVLFNNNNAIFTPNPILDPLEQEIFIAKIKEQDKKSEKFNEWMQSLRAKA